MGLSPGAWRRRPGRRWRRWLAPSAECMNWRNWRPGCGHWRDGAMRMQGRLARLERTAQQAGPPDEAGAIRLLADAMRLARGGQAHDPCDDGAPSLGELLAGTRAGAFLDALGAFGRAGG